MKILLYLFIPFLFINGILAQEDSSKLKTIHAFVPLNSYKEKYKKELTKKDSLNILIRGKDTLILDVNHIQPPGRSVPYTFKDESFLNLYKKIAFRPSEDSTKKSLPMRYWKEPIKIFISNSISKKVKRDFFKFSKQISSQIDSLKIEEVKTIEDSNYIIYQSGDFEYESRMSKYTSTDYYMSWNGNSQIYKTTLRLIKDDFFNSNLLLKGMKDYLLKSLGHFSLNSSLGCDNYFSGCQEGKITLTALDIELLKYHYNYGICKGTDIETFEAQHKRAKETLKKHNHNSSFFHLY